MKSKLPNLSAREREVFSLVSEGRSDKEIGEMLRPKISEHTVDSHVRHVFTKLRLAGIMVNSRTTVAVLYALQKPDKRQLTFFNTRSRVTLSRALQSRDCRDSPARDSIRPDTKTNL